LFASNQLFSDHIIYQIGLLVFHAEFAIDEQLLLLLLQVNRCINVDFNSLEANLNLQTWVIVLEFFGIGVPQQPPPSQPSSPNTTSTPHSNPWNAAVHDNLELGQIEGT